MFNVGDVVWCISHKDLGVVVSHKIEGIGYSVGVLFLRGGRNVYTSYGYNSIHDNCPSLFKVSNSILIRKVQCLK